MFQQLLSRFRNAPEADTVFPSKPRRALLLENDAIVSHLLADVLKAEGFQVHHARTAAEVSVQIRRERFDLVFLDGEGNPSILEAVKEIRHLSGPEDLTIVAIPDPSAQDSSTALIAAGADDCLQKPLVLTEVRARIRARLSGRGKSVRVEPEPAAPGVVLDGKFRLEEELGSGNFGTVYSARHLNLERQVAIKILHDKFFDQDEVFHRLRREGVSTCQVDHPNAVKVFDLSLSRDGESYLVMELLRGHNLEVEISQAPEGRLSLARAAQILVPVCRVLAEIHSLGMLHLDVKPGNIFLHERAGGEVVKVLDFGIVKMMTSTSENQGSSPEIHTNSFEGTPSYASLERLVGEPFGPKADVYSVGVVLYRMLTGRLPYQHAKSPVHLISLLMADDYPPIDELVPDLPPELVELSARSLGSHSKGRPSASAMADLLAGWLPNGETVS